VEGDIVEVCKDGKRKGFECCGAVEEVEGYGLQDGNEVGF